MDNGEGRPLDEAESGNEDPQGWYFDLPGGAWERQEEKNRNLRQRVLGNLSEDEARAKSDPFGRKPLEPEKKQGRSLFGRRKKEEESGDRTSAGGTWVLNRGSQEAPEPLRPSDAEDDFANEAEDDEWTTEPPLKLSAFPRAERREQAEWGESDGGWDLSRPEATEPFENPSEFAQVSEPEFEMGAADVEPLPFPSVASHEVAAVDDSGGTEDFLASMRSWAHQQPDAEAEAYRAPAIEESAFVFAPGETVPTEDETFEAPVYFAPIAEESREETEPETLTLRPRRHESDGKELDWNFGPAAWSDEPVAASTDPEPPLVEVESEPRFEVPDAADNSDEMSFESMRKWAELNREKDHPHFTVVHHAPDADAANPEAPAAERMEPEPVFQAPDETPGADSSDEMSFESMRKWAELNREKDHPHFTVAHHESEAEEATPGAMPIPLRPRMHDDEAPAASNLPPTAGDVHPDAPAPIQIPIVLRSRTEPQPEPVDPDAPSKWNDFFAITPPADSEESAGDEEGPSEGLAAMRAWAQKRAEPESPQDIPEEFLKPFDWELEENGEPAESPTTEIPADLLKPFAWEEAEAVEEPFALESFEPVAAVPETDEAEEPLGAVRSFPESAPLMASAFETEIQGLAAADSSEDDDPLDGLFPAADAPAAKEEKKPGRFGRLFGLGKNKQGEPEVAAPTDAGDWVLPTEDSGDDIRVAARAEDWTDDADTFEAADVAAQHGEGWGASLTSGWADSDNEAISKFSSSLFEATPEAPALEASATEEWAAETVAETTAPEAVAFAVGPALETFGDTATWEPEPAAFTQSDSEPAFSASEPVEEEGWNPEPVRTDDFAATTAWQPLESSRGNEGQQQAIFESFEWAPEPETEAPVEAVASLDVVIEEPVTEKAWWETDEPVTEAPVEAVASVDAVFQEPVAEKAWWESAAETEEPEADAPVEAVASVDAVVEEPVAEKAWRESAGQTDEPEVDAPIEAVASIDAVIEEPVAEKAWWETAAQADEPEAEAPVEAVASVDAVVDEPVAEKAWWETAAQTEEPVTEFPVEAVASVDAVVQEPTAEKAWWETAAEIDEPEAEAPIEAVASVDAVVEEPAEKAWWETDAQTDEPVTESPIEAVASVDAVVEEPVAEKAWWEAAAAEESKLEPSVEAVASVDAVVQEPVAEKAWWEAVPQTGEPEAESPVGAVASVDAVVQEPVAEKAWWESAAQTDEPVTESPIEAIASVDAVVDEPAAEKAWWETAPQTDEPQSEPSVEAVASVDAVIEEPVTEKAWWESAAQTDEPESEAPVEAVASFDAVVQEPVAEKAWWETAAEIDEPEAEALVEAVASFDAVVQEPVAEKAWWETAAQTDEPVTEAPIQTVASVDAVVQEPVAEKAWWETPAQTDEHVTESPIEAVASVDAVVEEPAVEKAWWETAAQTDGTESEAPVEAVAFVDAVVEESVSEWSMPEGPTAETSTDAAAPVADSGSDDDDPWADFVSAPASATGPDAAPAATSIPWRHEPVRPPADEDMWGHIADQAEEAAASDPHQIDLAASLESQMAETPDPAYRWAQPEEDEWEAAPTEARGTFIPDQEEDVILAAFERHAATPDATASRENDEVFAELLGTEAADIVAEADDEDAGKQSFIKMTGWAPQRGGSFDGGWAPEQEVEEALSGSRHSAFGGTDGAGFAPPPWAVDELEGDGEAQTAAHGHHRTKTWIRELVETGLLALLVFLSVRASFQNFKVEGSSMYPTLENGQFLIVNKLVYSEVDMDKLSSYVPFVDAGSDPKRQVFHGPERGDIIVLKDPRNTETDLIKRVIGLPGETIEIVDGKVYINDQLLDEPYIKAVWHDTKPKIAIPPGEFFVMGDNRDNSLDSRSSQVGLVPQDLIIGKAMLSYWPRDKFGLAPNEEGTLGDQKPALTTQRIGD